MVYFPILKELDIRAYGLYPGEKRDGRFELKFNAGLTMIIGANGLGKTTLMTLVFRMIAGTYDLNLPSEIGTANLEAQELNPVARRQFADRVNDGAQNAYATLKFDVASVEFIVERNLANLSLRSFSVGGQVRSVNEIAYHDAILDASGFGVYADWLLILRTLVFFFEDRRALVWDPGAQRQLLRCLFLSPERAQEWTQKERSILELDSRMRNLQAAVRKEQKIQAKTVKQFSNESAVRAALDAAEKSIEHLDARCDELAVLVENDDEDRKRHRLNVMRAQNEHDRSIREFERERLFAIEAHLPQVDASMRFLFARLMSDNTCLACGSSGVNAKRKAVESALEQHRCLVCDSNLSYRDETIIDLGDKRIAELRSEVESTRVYLQQQTSLFEEINARYKANSQEFTECSAERSYLQDTIRNLINQLPQDERKAREQHDKLRGIEDLVMDLRTQLNKEREQFSELLKSYLETIQSSAEAIKRQFKVASMGFLFEDSGLSWSPNRRTVGQAGGMEPVEYPAFVVELSGSDFVGLQQRSSPSQVSESQREFIDLAFRMALIDVASPEHAATLAVDAPESSLDAVFVDKAAQVLGGFAKSGHGNRLILTSNLGAGELVPQLLKEVAPKGQRMDPLVDLFSAGVPTRAMIDSKVSYDKYWDQLKSKVNDESES
jgi:hypothetical protein